MQTEELYVLRCRPPVLGLHRLREKTGRHMAALLKSEQVELDDLASRRQEVEQCKTYRKWGWLKKRRQDELQYACQCSRRMGAIMIKLFHWQPVDFLRYLNCDLLEYDAVRVHKYVAGFREECSFHLQGRKLLYRALDALHTWN